MGLPLGLPFGLVLQPGGHLDARRVLVRHARMHAVMHAHMHARMHARRVLPRRAILPPGRHLGAPRPDLLLGRRACVPAWLGLG